MSFMISPAGVFFRTHNADSIEVQESEMCTIATELKAINRLYNQFLTRKSTEIYLDLNNIVRCLMTLLKLL